MNRKFLDKEFLEEILDCCLLHELANVSLSLITCGIVGIGKSRR